MFNHDVALTKRHMVFVIDPITVDLASLPAVALGLKSFDRALRYRAQRGSTVVLVPRDGSKPRVLQTEALMHFHVNNAYEDGSDTVVDIVRWEQDWDEINPGLREFGTTDGLYLGGKLTRLRITPNGRVLREQLSDALGEFPQFDSRRSCRAHRYSYLAARASDNVAHNMIVKTDHRTSAEHEHVLPPGHVVSEPIFVPRRPDSGEDDGWLLAVAYDSLEHRSRLIVLDAQDPERDPLYVGHLRHHLPQSFHGTFTSRLAQPPL